MGLPCRVQDTIDGPSLQSAGAFSEDNLGHNMDMAMKHRNTQSVYPME